MDDVDRAMYVRIKRIASRFVRRRLNPTLNATAVANEVWIRLKTSSATLQVRDDSHFDALVGQAAGYVATDSARRRLARKRDGGVLSGAALDRQATRQASIDTILQVSQALAFFAAHAEVVAIRKAARELSNYRLSGLTLYVTVEPCMMCVGAIVQARIGTLVYGAPEPKFGAVDSLLDLREMRIPHRLSIVSGILEEECRKVLQDFFQYRRDND